MDKKERDDFLNKKLSQVHMPNLEERELSDYCKVCGNVFYNCVCNHEEY